MNRIDELKADLSVYIDREKAKSLPKFFQAFPGGYGEGDKFLGITVPNQRRIAKKYKDLPLEEIQKLLNEEYHEYRLTGLFILVHRFEKTKEEKKKIVDFYIENIDRINNWDLVDSTAYKILGSYLINRDKTILYDFANSNHLWKQRIAIIATKEFINNNMFEDTLKISEILLNHEHDLIHKAVGWMLREVGKKNKEVEIKFLEKHYKKMPRTMLRYAIEKFDKIERHKFLNGEI